MEQLGVGCTGPVGKPCWSELKGLIGLGLRRRTARSLEERIPGRETRLPLPRPLPVPPATAASWSPTQPWLKNNLRSNCS